MRYLKRIDEKNAVFLRHRAKLQRRKEETLSEITGLLRHPTTELCYRNSCGASILLLSNMAWGVISKMKQNYINILGNKPHFGGVCVGVAQIRMLNLLHAA